MPPKAPILTRGHQYIGDSEQRLRKIAYAEARRQAAVFEDFRRQQELIDTYIHQSADKSKTAKQLYKEAYDYEMSLPDNLKWQAMDRYKQIIKHYNDAISREELHIWPGSETFNIKRTTSRPLEQSFSEPKKLSRLPLVHKAIIKHKDKSINGPQESLLNPEFIILHKQYIKAHIAIRDLYISKCEQRLEISDNIDLYKVELARLKVALLNWQEMAKQCPVLTPQVAPGVTPETSSKTGTQRALRY